MAKQNVFAEQSQVVRFERYRWMLLERFTQLSGACLALASPRSIVMDAEQWLALEFAESESEVLIGTAANATVRPLTKNLVEAPEKSFKTTFLLRLALALSCGQTIFQELPIPKAHKVLYLHGELSTPELKQRLKDAATGLPRPLKNFLQGRSLDANLITPKGQVEIRSLVEKFTPEVLVLDPWQTFIAGADENSFMQVSTALSFIDELIHDSGLTVFIAVHLGKNAERGARGHSSIGGWRDTRFALSRSGQQLTVTVEPRWASPPKPLKLVFRNNTLWPSSTSQWTKQAQAIREFIQRNGGSVTRGALEAYLDLHDSGLRTAIQRAAEAGAIKAEGQTLTLP